MKTNRTHTNMVGVCSQHCILLLGPILATVCFAMPAGAAATTAEEVLSGYVNATGGQAAYDKVQTRITKAKVTLPGMGVAAEITTYQAKPDKAYIVTDSPASGKIESGCNGEVVWQNSAVMGPQIKRGPERTDLQNAAILDRFAYWRSAYQEVTFAGFEQVEGRPCHKLIAQPKGEGNAQTLFFDQETKLLVKLATKVQNAMGTIPTESHFSDYRSVDGVRLPHKVRVVLPQLGRELQTEVVSCENNAKLPPDRFELPPEIKTLARQ